MNTAQEIDDAVNSRFEGDYVESAELMPFKGGAKVVIESVIPPNTEKDARKKLIDKPIVVIKGGTKNKKMIVGKTNFRVLKSLFGSPSKWIGKEITIAARYLPKSQGFGQANCPCVRVIPPKGHPIPKSAYDFMGTEFPVGEGVRAEPE